MQEPKPAKPNSPEGTPQLAHQLIHHRKNTKSIIKIVSYGIASLLQSISTTFVALMYDRLADLLEKQEAHKTVTKTVSTFSKTQKVFSRTITLLENADTTESLAEALRAANSLIGAYQSMARNVGSGVLGVVGNELGKKIGAEDYDGASKVVIQGYLLTFFLTLFSSVAFLATPWLFKFLVEDETAAVASDYFIWSTIGNWPTLALSTVSPIAFQDGDWLSPLLSAALFRGSVCALSYTLPFTANLGTKGMGIANGIAPWVPYLLMEFHLRRKKSFNEKFNRYPLTRKNIVYAFQNGFGKFVVTGLQMGTQKFTEFGNALLLTFALRISALLIVINASLIVSGILSMFAQGCGMGGNMLLSEKHGELSAILKKINENPDVNIAEAIQEARGIQEKVKKIIIKSLFFAGALPNGAFAVLLFFIKSYIVNIFVPEDMIEERQKSETAMWIMGVGLFFDSFRIISGNLLNTWDKYVVQNMVALVLMSGIGIYGTQYAVKKLHQEDREVEIMLAVRAMMILICSINNMTMLYRCYDRDNKKIDEIEADHPTRALDSARSMSTVVAVRENNDEEVVPENSRENDDENAPEDATLLQEPAQPGFFSKAFYAVRHLPSTIAGFHLRH